MFINWVWQSDSNKSLFQYIWIIAKNNTVTSSKYEISQEIYNIIVHFEK